MNSTTFGASASEQRQGDSGIAALVVLLGFLQRAVDPDQLRHQLGHGAPSSAEEIVRLARRDGARAKLVNAHWPDLSRIPMPAILETTTGFLIVGATDGEQVLIQDPMAGSVRRLTRQAFEELATGRLILITTRESVAGQRRRFDIAWFIPALVRYRNLLGEVFVASLFIQVLGLLSPLFFQVVIDKVLVHKSLSTLEVLAVGLIGIFIFETLMTGLRQFLFAHTTSRVDVQLGARLFQHLQSLPMSYFGNRRVGDTIARVRELETIREFLTSNSITVVLDLIFTSIFLAVMYLYSPSLLLVVLISIPCYILISMMVLPGLRARVDEKFKRQSDNQSFLVESVSGIETLKAMAVEPQMQSRWERQLAGYVSAGLSAANLSNWGGQAIQLVSKLTTVAILFFGAKQVIAGDMTVGMLVAFNMLAGRVAQPVLRLAQLAQDFQQARLAVDRLGDILNTPAEPSSSSRATLPPIDGAIRFDQVRFRYRIDGPEVLRGINLSVAPGEMLGVVGPSGSGKSTLTKLIQRLHVPEQGRVLVDGVDLAVADPVWLRRQIGVVLQENILFNRSVRENIALADPSWPFDRVIKAATLAGAHEFILELPEGYDTKVEERGGNLSGGQRQRLAIARALIGDPRILIFDEATSALDAESEEIVQTNLRAIAQGRTVIIIAHRLSAVRQCHRIVTVEAGAIVEEGDHAALLAAKGRYAELHRRQMGLDLV
jgi:subfamily B ATP-binding cassette protein HlyB/CyaB